MRHLSAKIIPNSGMKLIKNAILSLLLVVLSLTLCEAVLRAVKNSVLLPQNIRRNNPDMQYEPVVCCRLKPELKRNGMLKTDSAGNVVVYDVSGRSEGPPVSDSADSADSLDVMIIGDSFTAGDGVLPYQDYASLLYSEIARDGKKPRFVNFAVPGHNLPQYFYTLRRERERFKPDFVIVGFFIGNDFMPFTPESETMSSLKTNSYLFDAVFRSADGNGCSYPCEGAEECENYKEMLDDFDVKRHFPGWPRDKRNFKEKFKEHYGVELADDLLPSVIHNFHVQFFMMERSEKNVPVAAAVARNLEQMKRSAGGDTVFLVMMIPSKQQIVDEKWRAEMDIYGLRPEKYERFRPQRLLASELDKLDVDYLDPAPVFMRRADRRKLYLENDGHWSAEGHRAAADALARRVQRIIAQRF